MTHVETIWRRHTPQKQRPTVCECGASFPCDAAVLAEELTLANEILEKPLYDDVDLSMTAGLIQLRGDSRVLANLDGAKADILRDMLDDLIGERDGTAQDLNIGIEPEIPSTLISKPARDPDHCGLCGQTWNLHRDGDRCPDKPDDFYEDADDSPLSDVDALCPVATGPTNATTIMLELRDAQG